MKGSRKRNNLILSAPLLKENEFTSFGKNNNHTINIKISIISTIMIKC